MEPRSIRDVRSKDTLRPQETQLPASDKANDESTPVVAEDSKQLVVDAEKVCAIVLANGKTNGRFSMALSALRRAAAPKVGEWGDAVACGIRANWLRSGNDCVELTAAGIYVAKSILNLPR